MRSKYILWVCFTAIIILSNNADAQACETNTNIGGCASVMNVSWVDHAPYVTISNNNTKGNGAIEVNGTLKYIIEEIVKSCCGCVRFQYLPPLKNLHSINKEANNMESKSDLIFPVYGKYMTDLMYNNFPYFPVVETPGILYLQNKAKSRKTYDKLIFESIISGWPVMVICLVLAAISGFILNLLDTNDNPAHFPRPLHKGSWEGFWWAFVTMTTVGYGDRVPKSFHARIFSFFWVMIGATILGLFTSTMSSKLTELSVDANEKLYGKQVVVFEHTNEFMYAEKNNAKTVAVTTIDDFVKKLSQNPQVSNYDGGLIDTYYAGHHKEKLDKAEEIEIREVMDYQYTYGFVLPNLVALTDMKLQKCLRRAINETKITQIVQRNLRDLSVPHDDDKVISDSLLDGRSDIFLKVVYVCLGVSALLLLILIAWENYYILPRRKKEKGEDTKDVSKEFSRKKRFHQGYSVENLIRIQSLELEKAVMDEVASFHDKFIRRMNEVKNGDV